MKNKKTLFATIWSVVDNFSTQFLGFIIGIVLARLLSPSDYGTVGVLVIFIGIANVFVDCGFAIGLIRKKERTDEDLATAFYFNVIVGVITYLILFFISPWVAAFFKMPILVVLLRVLALCLIFNSLSIVQNAILTAALKTKVQARVNISTQFIMGCVGIYLAFKGYGVWTLVIQQVGSSILKCVFLWITVKWLPNKKWSKNSFMYLFGFGWKLLGANLIGTFFNQIHSFFIGRALGASELGLYTKANDLSSKPNDTLLNVVNRIALPILSSVNDNITQIKNAYSKMIRLGAFVSFPLFALLILIAKPLIIIMWTDKWLECVNLFQLLCISASFGIISQLGLTIMQLMNRTDLTLKFEFYKKPVTLILLILAMPFGLFYITLSAVVASIYCCLVNMYATKMLITYTYKEQFKDFSPYLLISMIACAIGYIPTLFFTSNYLLLVVSSLFFIGTYLLIAYLFRVQGMRELLSLIKK